MSSSASYPYCIATVVTNKAIEAMLESGGEGTYKDTHPWLVANEFLQDAQAKKLKLPLLLASLQDSGEIIFSHWSVIDQLEVVEPVSYTHLTLPTTSFV